MIIPSKKIGEKGKPVEKLHIRFNENSSSDDELYEDYFNSSYGNKNFKKY